MGSQRRWSSLDKDTPGSSRGKSHDLALQEWVSQSGKRGGGGFATMLNKQRSMSFPETIRRRLSCGYRVGRQDEPRASLSLNNLGRFSNIMRTRIRKEEKSNFYHLSVNFSIVLLLGVEH
jgi:hypothetical protein